MKKLSLSLPQLALIVATRAMAVAGVALLFADRLDRRQRRAVGRTLVAVGAITTLPLAVQVIAELREPAGESQDRSSDRQHREAALAGGR